MTDSNVVRNFKPEILLRSVCWKIRRQTSKFSATWSKCTLPFVSFAGCHTENFSDTSSWTCSQSSTFITLTSLCRSVLVRCQENGWQRGMLELTITNVIGNISKILQAFQVLSANSCKHCHFDTKILQQNVHWLQWVARLCEYQYSGSKRSQQHKGHFNRCRCCASSRQRFHSKCPWSSSVMFACVCWHHAC